MLWAGLFHPGNARDLPIGRSGEPAVEGGGEFGKHHRNAQSTVRFLAFINLSGIASLRHKGYSHRCRNRR
jgi:hypothetical protein